MFWNVCIRNSQHGTSCPTFVQCVSIVISISKLPKTTTMVLFACSTERVVFLAYAVIKRYHREQQGSVNPDKASVRS